MGTEEKEQRGTGEYSWRADETALVTAILGAAMRRGIGEEDGGQGADGGTNVVAVRSANEDSSARSLSDPEAFAAPLQRPLWTTLRRLIGR